MDELKYLLETSPPPFIFVSDPVGPRTSAKALRSLLSSLRPQLHFVQVNAIACFTPKLFYDVVLNGLAEWTPDWEEGCANWPGTSDFARYSDSLDGFMHGIKAVHGSLCQDEGSKKLVLAIEQSERLAEKLPEIIVPLTRLAEIVQLDVCVIFLSAASWEDIRPSLGAAEDPYYIDIPIPEKDAALQHLLSTFQAAQSEEDAEANTYHPTLAPAYQTFSSVLYDICAPFTHDPEEITYVAAACWPHFIQPVLDNYQRQLEGDDTMEIDGLSFVPTQAVRNRLTRYFAPSISSALDTLYPRSTDAQAWVEANKPTEEALLHAFPDLKPEKSRNNGGLDPQQSAVLPKEAEPDSRYKDLTRMAKFVLIASYIASMNPAKSDLRMFGRGLDEKKRKRRRIARVTKTKSGPVKIPQRFLGPAVFPLDRMLAILGALLEDNDNDDDDLRPSKMNFMVPGEYTDTEITRVGVYAIIVDLTSAQLLYRTTNTDKIDGPPMLKCGVSHEVVNALAKELDVPFNDLLWDFT
ncbi:hypothetical protein BDZ89DRAFT_1061614 [Hymenopellis radicata]|nr:hypothetical protein BDZ89DRAFT_1061614 [Hymenopellis radicata]